jgi:hypothetical protein
MLAIAWNKDNIHDSRFTLSRCVMMYSASVLEVSSVEQ